MTVLNNTAAAMTLGELNKNVSQVGKQPAKVSSGQKITGAGNGASEYSVSERMRVRIRGLEQDIQNTKTGTSMLKTADGGVQNIIEELKSLRELAINAANDHNTDLDRATIQKEFNQRKADIEDIATSTNYNGKLLLDGTYRKGSSQIVERLERIWHPGGGGDVKPGGDLWEPDGFPANVPNFDTGVVEPTDYKRTFQLGDGDRQIDEDGVYYLGAGYTGQITISDTAKNVKIVQETETTLQNVSISGPESGDANLWIEGLKVNNTTDESFIRFHGLGNVLTLKGANSFKASSDARRAAVYMGDELTVESSGTGSLDLSFSKNYGAGIGLDADEKKNAQLVLNRANVTAYQANGRGALIGTGQNGYLGNIIVNRSNVKNPQATNGYATTIGTGQFGTVGNILINESSLDLKTSGGCACIGSCSEDHSPVESSAHNILIQNSTIKAEADDGACIGNGVGKNSGLTTDSIYIYGSDLKLKNHDVYGNGGTDLENKTTTPNLNQGTGACIGCGWQGSSGNIYIDSCTIEAFSVFGAAIGTGWEGTVNNITIKNTPDVDDPSKVYAINDYVINDVNKAVGKGVGGRVQGEIHVNDGEDIPDPSLPPDPDDGWWEERVVREEQKVPGKPLVIHTGTRANQALYCYIDDMRLDALGLGQDKETGVDKVQVVTRRDAEVALGAMVKENWSLVDPLYDDATEEERNNPDNYKGPIDRALDYVLDQSTQLGAYLMELEYTASNLVTAHENTTASESVIRDADMAKEMTAYTKANVLQQASQSMLAQANQTMSSVLSLLQ